MKRFTILVSAVTVFSVIITACNLGATPPPAIQVPATEPATEAPATEPAATDAPAAVPIDLAGPPMKVGSFYTYVDGSVLAAVPGGPFIMGYINFNDSKEHEVTLGDFWIYTNEVTNQQFEVCVGAGKCSRPDKEDNPAYGDYRYVNYPVVGVNYDKAASYCEFVHGRLPTEAEWEKAARGPEGNLFPWGDTGPVCDLLNFNFCKGKAIDVLSYPDGVSYYGLSDMSGNVTEWVADWYKPDYDLSASIDPLGPALGEKRSVRSSSFEDGGDASFSAHRFSLKPTEHLPGLGFRCVVDDPTFFAPYCQGLALYGAGLSGAPGGVPVVPASDTCEQAGLSGPTHGGCGDPLSYITIDPYPNPDGTTLDVPAACVGGPPTYACSGSGVVSIFPQPLDQCDFEPPPSVVPECQPGYGAPEDDGLGNITCAGQGPGANCPDGFELDPLLNCCSAVNPGPNQYGYCIGFDQVGSDCYYNPGDPYTPHVVDVPFAPNPPCPDCPDGNCEPPPDDDDDDTTCPPNNPYCNRN